MTDYHNHSENPGGSNLVAHALRELDIIGETSHEWQCRRDSECFSHDRGKTYTRNSEPDVVHNATPAVA